MIRFLSAIYESVTGTRSWHSVRFSNFQDVNLREINLGHQFIALKNYLAVAEKQDVLWSRIPWIWLLIPDISGVYIHAKARLCLENPLLDSQIQSYHIDIPQEALTPAVIGNTYDETFIDQFLRVIINKI
jgi:hypothetical protein